MGDKITQTFNASIFKSSETTLLERVSAACRRLAPTGWGQLLKLHGLDIRAANLGVALARPLTIDRLQPGFEDFASEGVRAIEPGFPTRSFLFHAFASPTVTHYSTPAGRVDLAEYPTIAEIEAVENYVYASGSYSIEDLRAKAGNAPLAIVVFTSEYRPASDTVHRRHADMCFSRTGVSRIGTHDPEYLPAARGFVPVVAEDSHAVAVQPCRYAAYIAALKPGEKHSHGPMQFVEPKPKTAAGDIRAAGKDAGIHARPTALSDDGTSDADRQFWLPLHKLFDGNECLNGYNIRLRLAAQHVNEKIRRAHLFFGSCGHDSGWREPDISESPFIIHLGIAEFSNQPIDGSWLLRPGARKQLIEAAIYKGQPLTYLVPSAENAKRWSVYQSSVNLSPAANGARAAPEYLHARHAIDGARETNLNESPGLVEAVRAGGYRARHYVDYTGDGWIDVECSALALEIPRRLPAYSIVASPDFFPAVRQSELTTWTDQSAPPKLLDQVWPVNPGRPEPLSSQRYAANLELAEAGFNPADDTMTAIIGACGSGEGRQMRLRPSSYVRASMLPDGAAGVFAPGWDVSYDRTSESDAEDNGGDLDPGVTFLNNYGLGSPFPEDSMLCAALSSFWPAVAPDITRTFAPNRRYATATPLVDEVIGLGAAPPWDGIKGPIPGPTRNSIDYKLLAYGDYVEAALAGSFDLTRITQTDTSEYIARTVTMALVYEALGLAERLDKARWSVLSFNSADPADPDLIAGIEAHGRELDARHTYRFEMIRHDGVQSPHPDPAKFDRVIVTYTERVVLFADPTIVLRRETGGAWVKPYERSV